MAFNRKNLIVSADDFGISQAANNNILALAEAGKLDRVAIMTHGVFSSEEITRLKNSGTQLDIHLDSNHQISIKRKLSDGVFIRGFKFLGKLLSDYFSAHSNQLQWENQLQDFHALLGKYPDGINSHQHIHFFPAYFKIIARLAKKYNINFIRFGKKGLIRSHNLVYYILCCLRKINQKKFLSFYLNSSDYMLSFDWSKNISKTLTQLPAGTIEIVCHPERPEEFEFIQKNF